MNSHLAAEAPDNLVEVLAKSRLLTANFAGPTKLLYSWFRDWSPSLGSEVPTPGSDSSQTSTTAATKSVKQPPHNLVGPNFTLLSGTSGTIRFAQTYSEIP